MKMFSLFLLFSFALSIEAISAPVFNNQHTHFAYIQDKDEIGSEDRLPTSIEDGDRRFLSVLDNLANTKVSLDDNRQIFKSVFKSVFKKALQKQRYQQCMEIFKSPGVCHGSTPFFVRSLFHFFLNIFFTLFFIIILELGSNCCKRYHVGLNMKREREKKRSQKINRIFKMSRKIKCVIFLRDVFLFFNFNFFNQFTFSFFFNMKTSAKQVYQLVEDGNCKHFSMPLTHFVAIRALDFNRCSIELKAYRMLISKTPTLFIALIVLCRISVQMNYN